MDKRTASGREEPIPSILKKPKSRRIRDLLDKSFKIKCEKVDDRGASASKKSDKVSTPLPQGCTSLMYACQQADYKAVVEILNKDPSTVRVRDRGLRCALHYCASSGASANQAARAACADRVLMAAPVLADARDSDGLTPLHLAVVHGNVPLVQTLLAAGADVNARDDEHHTVVHWATVCGEVGALRAVLAAGADPATPDQHGGYPLHYAAQMCGAPAATDHQSRGAALEVLRALVKEGGASVEVRDSDGRTPLLWAASAGSAAAVLALHQAGSKVDDADRDGLTALHCAAARGHTETLETLISLCGASVDVADTHGCTPLHYAAALGHADATVALLQQGADPHRQDKKGRSPAHTAAAKGQIETLRILGARGANLWLRNSRGDLPLHEAVSSGRRELVKWLLDGRPSQVNATNHEGRTPLHIAASTDNTDLCRLLLDRGAEINPITRSPKNEPLTPLDCATTRGHRSTAKYLQMHGATPASKLRNAKIVIDSTPITSLPTRRVTSTKIDVRDRIRIEKKEVLEISSPVQETKYLKDKINYDSTDTSITDDGRTLRRKSHRSKNNDRRKQSFAPHKSFSDGYDTESEVKEPKDAKTEKKNRSRSEPSRCVCSSKRRQKYYSETGSSSDVYDKSERKRSKRHSKHSKKKSKTPSDSSSSESSDRRNTKKKGKRTSIHIENDEEKQKVNIVKYFPDSENLQMEQKQNSLVERQNQTSENKISVEKEENVVKSETETDNVSVKTNMVVTEAQIHMERELSKNGSSEITVTVDSSNNVSIETSNMSVSHKDLSAENTMKKFEVNTLEANQLKENEEALIENCEGQKKPEICEQNSIKGKSDEEIVQPETVVGEEIIQISSENNTEAQKNEQIRSDGEMNKDDVLIPSSSTEQNFPEESNKTTLEKPRKRSFQVLSGPEDTSSNDKLDSPNEKLSLNETTTAISSVGNGEVFENTSHPHVMGEKVSHLETDSDVLANIKNGTNVHNVTDENAEVISTACSVDEVESVDKGLVTVIDETTPKEARAVRQVIMETVSDNMNIPSFESSERVKLINKDGERSFSRKNSIYETESYKVLSERKSADNNSGILKKTSLPDDISIEDENSYIQKLTREGPRKNPSVSDNEIYSHSEANGRRKRFRKKGRTKSRITIRSRSENSERGYESSGFMDSGFEPSPRTAPRRILSPRLAAFYQQRNTSGRYSGKFDSRIPVRKPGDKHAVDMKSVTQRIQTNMRRYYCERKIFQHLLELKRLQIRTNKANEAVLVKRTIDEYNKSSLSTVGLGPYSSQEYSFISFEKFLYESLRKLQRSGKRHLENLPVKPIEFDYGDSELYKMTGIPDNPCLCTNKTHRCFHAVHAYTGIPCSAYIPYKWNHHTMPKPSTVGTSTKSRSFLPKIQSKPPLSKSHVTLEVAHGTEKQLIALPAEKLDRNKRYYVTFTVKGSEPASDAEGVANTKSVRSG